MRAFRPILLSVATVFALACGSDPSTGDTGNDSGDTSFDTFEPDTSGELDSTDDDVGVDSDDEVAAPCATLGCPCEDDLECASGYCLESPESGRVCSEFCADECSEPEYDCRLLVNSGGDAVRLCVPASDRYCEECEVVSDCGDLRADCYTLASDMNICVTPCDEETRCPSGASCSVLVIGGEESTYCVPDDGVCDRCIDEDGDFPSEHNSHIRPDLEHAQQRELPFR